MSRRDDDPPAPAAVAAHFHVTAVERDGETVRYLGDALVPPTAVTEELRGLFRSHGYTITVRQRGRQGPAARLETPGSVTQANRAAPYELVAEPIEGRSGADGVPWLNVVLLLVTIASTLYVGASRWYYIPVFEAPWRIVEAWPFVVAMLGVLGIHELGHYAAAKYHGVAVTLPYFIPFPSLLGTMGAVINIRGRIPSRRVLFDIGVAGPIAGLVATVVVTVVGLTLDPIEAPQRVTESTSAYLIQFNDPLLLQAIEWAVATAGIGAVGPGGAVHPIVFAGWAGMFFTFLNLLPVGQLDGGHLVRAIVGQRQETIAAAVPGALFALAGFLYLTRDPPPVGFGVWTLWVFWGLFATGLAYAGPASPTVDEPVDRRRAVLGLVTFGLGLACFTPIPFEIVSA